jgi:hypothetical protein
MSRADFLAAPIGMLTDFWLGLRCALPCTKIAYVPLKLMAARKGAALKLGDAVKRRSAGFSVTHRSHERWRPALKLEGRACAVMA